MDTQTVLALTGIAVVVVLWFVLMGLRLRWSVTINKNSTRRFRSGEEAIRFAERFIAYNGGECVIKDVGGEVVEIISTH
jgi:hypothetical protein